MSFSVSIMDDEVTDSECNKTLHVVDDVAPDDQFIFVQCDKEQDHAGNHKAKLSGHKTKAIITWRVKEGEN